MFEPIKPSNISQCAQKIFPLNSEAIFHRFYYLIKMSDVLLSFRCFTVQDGQVQIVEAVLGHGLTLQCHLPDVEDVSSVTVRWERWATYHGAGFDATDSGLARRRRRRRLIHQSIGSALRFASISQEDEGLYRCVGTGLIVDTAVDESRRRQLVDNDSPSLISTSLDQLDDVTIVSSSAINDEQQSGEGVTSSTTSTTITDDDDDDDGGVSSTTTPVYGSFIYLRIQGKIIKKTIAILSRLSFAVSACDPRYESSDCLMVRVSICLDGKQLCRRFKHTFCKKKRKNCFFFVTGLS